MRRLALAFVFLMGMVALPRSGFAGPLVLQFWHSMSGEKGKLIQALVQEFNALSENQEKIQVQAQFVGTYEEGLNKLRTSLLANRGPHVAQITDIGTQIMIDTGAVVPLQDFIQGDAEFPSKELLRPIRRYYEVNGRLYSLPFATSNPIIYYNATAFENAGVKSPPKSFEELEAVAKKLSDKEKKTTGITWPLHSWFFEQFMARQGAMLLNNENGRKGRASAALFTSPEAIAFVSLWARMVKEGSFANVGRGWEPAEQNFLAGRSAMLITSTSDVFEIGKKAPFKVMTAAIPAKVVGSAGGTVVGGNSLWILKRPNAEEPKAAYRFVKFMASKSAQRKWHQGTGYFPIRSDVIAELEKEGFYTQNPNARTAIDQMRSTSDIAATWGARMGVFPEAREAVEAALEQILTTGADPAAALAKAKSTAEQALARYNRGRDKS